MTYADWNSWGWDHTTAGWLVWISYFIVWEAYTGFLRDGEMLTDHLRPLFLSAPVLWWLTLGLWLWLGIHFLAPAWERSLLDLVSTRRL